MDDGGVGGKLGGELVMDINLGDVCVWRGEGEVYVFNSL